MTATRSNVGMNLTMAQAMYAFAKLYGRPVDSDNNFHAELNQMYAEHGKAGISAALGSYSTSDHLAGKYKGFSYN